MEHKDNEPKYGILMIPVVVVNGILSGIISVITAYFFKPIWHKIMGLWNNERKIN